MRPTNQRHGLFGDDGSETIFRAGYIRYWNPDKETYRISLDGMSEGVGRPVKNGAFKPFPADTRVLCLLLPTTTWLVLGEIGASRNRDEVPQAPDDEILQKDIALRRALHDRYDIDSANFADPAEDPVLEGDALLSNRAKRRSFFRVFENGDLLSLASTFCFLLMSKAKRLFYVWAKQAFFYFAGLVVRTRVNDETKTATVELAVNSDPSDEADRDVTLVAGYVKSDTRQSENVSDRTKSRQLEEGVWLLFGGHSLLEVDNQAEEIRLSQVSGSASRQQIRMNPDETVLDWEERQSVRIGDSGIEARWKEAALSLADEAVRLELGGSAITINQDGLSVVWGGGTHLILNDHGVQVRGLLELAGEGILFSPNAQEPAGVSAGARANLMVSVSGSAMTWRLQDVTSLDLVSNFTVRNLALVDERFLGAYDQDMLTIKGHTHPVPPALTAILSPNLATADLPPANARKTTLTSKAVA